MPLLRRAAEGHSNIPIPSLCPSQASINPGPPISRSFEADSTAICIGTRVPILSFGYCKRACAVVDDSCIGVAVGGD